MYLSNTGPNLEHDAAGVFIPGLGQPGELSGPRTEGGTRPTPRRINLPTLVGAKLGPPDKPSTWERTLLHFGEFYREIF